VWLTVPCWGWWTSCLLLLTWQVRWFDQV
jgi:hypothetical protein